MVCFSIKIDVYDIHWIGMVFFLVYTLSGIYCFFSLQTSHIWPISLNFMSGICPIWNQSSSKWSWGIFHRKVTCSMSGFSNNQVSISCFLVGIVWYLWSRKQKANRCWKFAIAISGCVLHDFLFPMWRLLVHCVFAFHKIMLLFISVVDFFSLEIIVWVKK